MVGPSKAFHTHNLDVVLAAEPRLARYTRNTCIRFRPSHLSRCRINSLPSPTNTTHTSQNILRLNLKPLFLTTQSFFNSITTNGPRSTYRYPNDHGDSSNSFQTRGTSYASSRRWSLCWLLGVWTPFLPILWTLADWFLSLLLCCWTADELAKCCC